MAANARINPVVSAACGMAVAYYCLFPLYRSEIITINALLALLFIPVAVLCFFRVLVSWPLMGDIKPRTVRVLRLTPVILTAFTAGLPLGIGAGVQSAQKINFGIPEENVRGISGVLLDDPRLVSGGRAMAALSIRMITGTGMVRVGTRGELTVFFPEESAERLREFGRGTEVFAEGTLRTGNDGAYLFAAESLHITKQAPPFEHFRTGLRLGLTRRFTSSWGGLALALLLGIRDNLDAGIAARYRDAGCSHILALSGMHLAVLVALISFLLRRILGLRLSAICGAVLILAYCYIVGPLPSLNRAALMYLVGVFAVLGMFKREALSLLCIAFLIQLVITPKAGLSLSFILSYLALAGILIIGESLNSIFKGKAPAVLLLSLSASLGAFIATAGVTAWVFGILRPVGILASLILTPLTTVFMIGSMVWLVINLALPVLSPLLSYPLLLLYRLMDKTAFFAALTPGVKGQPWLIISLSLLSMAVIFWFEYRRRLAANRLDPFA